MRAPPNEIQFPIPLHYCSGLSNFGDELSPYLIQRITGRPVTQASESFGLYSIGSILDWDVMHSNCFVWGSGTLTSNSLSFYPHPFPLSRSLRTIIKRLRTKHPLEATICAVRGPLTRQQILNIGGKCPKIFGDPAILLPSYFNPPKQPIYPVGLILHHSQERLQGLEQIKDYGVFPISIRCNGEKAIETFIRNLCQCEVIFSTSLHGLIVAQAYGIKAQWITLKNKPIHRDAAYKFMDYFLGVGAPIQKPVAIELRKDSLCALRKVVPETFTICEQIKSKLLTSFPSKFL